ncbi:hypothetical protein F5148DRAFT_654881 [Russula earlei]|uniref:Uncharacterized protein n=1 Tax=Russula earlei TaxID=71964 RepID=A0ACC0UMG3_9AGAM|nr:hypothetical protein F5148DRAFT_654881 [Russula earlei]
MRPFALLVLLLPALSLAQDGSVSGATSSAAAAGYSCDPTVCKLPACNCASTSPPGGLSPVIIIFPLRRPNSLLFPCSEVPMFIVYTADDAVQSYTLDSVNQFLAHRKNPNGCQPKMSYYVSLNYTNYTLVTDWYVAGNEIADHTMTHVGLPPNNEIDGNLIALNALAGIPLSAISGFRAPYLNFSNETLTHLAAAGFTYDTSATASIPVTANYTDAFWPYTLDYGLANNCLTNIGVCHGQPKLPGFWEVPMYALFDSRGQSGIHLMDPWLDSANGGTTVDDNATLAYMQSTFMAHYNGNRQPFGLYTHPIHTATTYPGVQVPLSTINMINAFLDWAQVQAGVWIVSTEQLLSWVQNPVPLSQLNSFEPLKCSTPQVNASICDGIPANEHGLLDLCAFSDFPFFTCYGCPVTEPTPDNPNPVQVTSNGQQPRERLPANCSTPWWDPIAGKCLCTGSSCQFQDNSRPIGPNGANLTGGGFGGNVSSPSASATFVPFNGNAAPIFPIGTWPAIMLGVFGVVCGLYTVQV